MVQLWNFGSSVYYLNQNTGEMGNKFKDVAVDRFLSYMVGVNLDLLWGYALVGAGIVLLAWPIVAWFLRHKERVTPFMILWRAALVGGGVWTFFGLRFFYARPYYFSINPESQTYFFKITNAMPETMRWVVFGVGPFVVTGLLAVYYATRLIAWRAPKWPAGATRLAGFSTVIILLLGSYAWTAFHSRNGTVVKTDTRPNILILASDSMRADHLSCNGYPRKTSPSIDALAEKSVNFTKCFTPIASTLESMTSIMSGQYPHTHGLQHMFPNRQQVDHVMKNSPTLAGQLLDAGYNTAVMGDWCAGIFDLLPHGFKEKDVSTFDNFKIYMTQAVYKEHSLLPLFFENDMGYKLFPNLKSCADFVTPEVVTERLKQKLSEESRQEKPFFITTFYSTTHLPYTINPPYSRMFTDPNYKGQHQGRMQFNVDKFIGDVNVADKWLQMPKDEVDQIVGLYDGCVAKFDTSVKQILDHLKSTGQDKNTIVIITSDHGDDLFEPNCTFGHGLTFNGGDQNGNIPFILHIPGMEQKPKKVENLVRSIDFAPTLLDLVGVKRDPRIEGVSLRPYIENKGEDLSLALFAETSYLFCKRYVPGEEPLIIPDAMDSNTFVDESFNCHFVLKEKFQELVLQTKERCLRTERWKLVFTPGKFHDIWRLFDLRKDTHCERPVNLEHPVVFMAMQKKLLEWMREKKESRINEIFPDGEPTGEVVKK